MMVQEDMMYFEYMNGRDKGYRDGFESGYKKAVDTMRRNIKAQCNPYGKPTIPYDVGIKLIDLLDRMYENPEEVE